MTDQIKLANYTRRPFDVDAVKVTPDNIEDVASRVGGELHNQARGRYIDVPVKNAQTPRQKHAYIGDWVVYHQGGWKVYNDRAFTTSYQRTTEVANDLESFARRENGHNTFSDGEQDDLGPVTDHRRRIA